MVGTVLELFPERVGQVVAVLVVTVRLGGLVMVVVAVFVLVVEI